MTDWRAKVVGRLEDAGRTLMMLPMPPRAMPSGARSAWPDVLQRFWDVAGVADKGTFEERQKALALVHNAVTLRASRAAVTRLDEVLGWLWFIEEAKSAVSSSCGCKYIRYRICRVRQAGMYILGDDLCLYFRHLCGISSNGTKRALRIF